MISLKLSITSPFVQLLPVAVACMTLVVTVEQFTLKTFRVMFILVTGTVLIVIDITLSDKFDTRVANAFHCFVLVL